MKELNDTDGMPFGKHKGVLMQDLPAAHLHFLWHNGLRTEKKPVANYIRRCLNALRKETPDLIWEP